MKSKFENKLEIGNGIYTTVEIAHILQVPYQKVHTWINKYWDGDLGKAYENQYSWTVDKTKAVGFHTLIEFYVMMLFADSGVNPKQVLQAHKELSKTYDTPFPFAKKEVLSNIKTDGKKIYLTKDGSTLTLDGTKQFNLNFIKMFFKNLDFDDDLVAKRYWPLGKNHKIVCDPSHKFGQAVIDGTNIQAEAIYKMFMAKEPIPFIADLYEVSEEKVKDAIKFYKQAA